MSNNYNSILQGNNTDLQQILNKINELPEADNGVELPSLTNEGSASDLLSGKQLIDDEGKVVEGNMPNNGSVSSTMDGINTKSITIPTGYTSGGTVSLDGTIDNEVEEQADIISQIKSVVDNLPNAGSGVDVSAETTDYTSLLDELETAINNLPEAGEGGNGGGGTEITGSTSLTISADLGWLLGGTYLLDKVAYYNNGELIQQTVFNNGEEIGLGYNLGDSPYLIENVDINKPIFIQVYCDMGDPIVDSSLTTAECIFNSISDTRRTFVFQITSAEPMTIVFN